MRRSFRVLPALIASALLLLALSSPAKRAPIPAADANSAAAGPCLQFQGGGSGLFLSRGTGQGVTQPIGFAGNVESCSLTVQHSYGYGTMEVVAWDPVTLAPDPTTLAFSSASFGDSQLLYGWTRASFYPPVIMTASPHVAEPPRQTLAIKYSVGFNTQNIAFESSGDPSTPAAFEFDANGVLSPMPGAHPILAHAVCGGGEATNDLRVVQSVMTTNVIAADTSSGEALQLFTVPVPTAVYWAEVAPGGSSAPPTDRPDVTIIDANGSTVPPATFDNTSLLAQQFLSGYYRLAWIAAYDFNQRPILEPGHKYWLRVRSFHNYSLHGRARTQPENWDFTFGIGPLYKRRNASSAWEPVNDVSLSFRLIGAPTGPGWVGVPGSSPATAMRLHVAPNPSRGLAHVSWTGGQGAVRLSLLDARGRRVGGTSAQGDGQWTLPAGTADGRPLAAGVYFLRAVDTRGVAVSERVVIQR
jgi:hypothetical protein